jgi:hypothetical protein
MSFSRLERIKKFCSRLRASRESGLFEFCLRFGSVAGRIGHAPSPKPRQNSKILASNGYRISLTALGLLIPQLFLGGRNHMVRVESELFLKLLERRRSAEGLHADDTASSADIAFPAKG